MYEYKSRITHCRENKRRPREEWLEYETTFPKPGKQGLVGLLKFRDDRSLVIFKISQYINYLIQHEYAVMKGLNDLALFCPHFCKVYGAIECEVDSRCRKEGNPFKITSKHPIQKNILLMEYVDKAQKFNSYIRNEKFPEDILYSICKQVIVAINIAQKLKRFAHYDLHSENILLKKCSRDLVLVYVLENETQFAVPTLGYYPKIIDYGFSYISDMDDDYCWPSMGHTDVGFMSDRFDWVADPKLFLVSVSHEIKQYRGTKKSKLLRRIVKNLFGPLNIEWDAGWDKDNDMSAADYISRKLDKVNTTSVVFDDLEHYCIDIIQSLIVLPMSEQNTDNIKQAYSAFLEEFIKIENEIGDPFYNLYILKGIVDSARAIRPAYIDKTQRTAAIRVFREDIYAKIDQVANYCNPKSINFEKMLCSLYLLAKGMEGILYKVINKRMTEKEKEYVKMPLQNIEHIYGCLEHNLPDEYVYNEKTTALILDSVKKEAVPFKIPAGEIDALNNIHGLSKGVRIYELYQQSLQESNMAVPS